MKTQNKKETAPASKLDAASIASRTDKMNRRRKRTLWQVVTAPFRCKDYNREYDLQMKRNALAGAVLIPSQRVFTKQMGGFR